MEYFAVGEIMRKTRLNHGLTQEELAFGICSVSTLSKIENGICEPRGCLFEALMCRMGETGSRYVFFSDKKNLERRMLLRQMEKSIRFREKEKISEMLEEYHRLQDEEGPLDGQGRMAAEAALMIADQTDPEKVRAHLHKALDITCPDLRKYWSRNALFTRRELLIFQMLAYCRQLEGQYRRSEVMLEWILRYQKMNLSEEDMLEDVEPSVYYQLAELYLKMRQIPDSRAMCARGIRYCIRTEKCQFLLLLLTLKTNILAEIGDTQESRMAEAHASMLRDILANQDDLPEMDEIIRSVNTPNQIL